MYKILSKRELNNTVMEMIIEAPLVAKKAKPGQFIILRVSQIAERIPLTIAGVKDNGIKIIFQIVGSSTLLLSKKEVGEELHDFVGPLGKATELDGLKDVCVVGGGVGCAIALPIAEALRKNGANVTSIIGFRNKDLVILEDEFKACSNELIVTTDDGSYARKGNVTEPLKELLTNKHFDKVITIGPLVMMKYVTLTCKEFNMPVIVSMNPIMIDGTGMCGGCRLTLNIDGKKVTKFACVDGPDFDGYQIDFDEASMRNKMYSDFEKHAYENTCNLLSGGKTNV